MNRLVALCELIDSEFEGVRSQMREDKSIALLTMLERTYYSYTAVEYDRELSVDTIRALLPLRDGDVPATEALVQAFTDDHGDKFGKVLARESPDDTPLLFQPEAVWVLAELESDRFALRQAWANVLPDEELQALAIAWGKSLD